VPIGILLEVSSDAGDGGEVIRFLAISRDASRPDKQADRDSGRLPERLAKVRRGTKGLGTSLEGARVVRVDQIVLPQPIRMSDFQCYKIKITSGSAKFVTVSGVTAQDQFGTITVDVKKPKRFCAPVNKNGEAPGDLLQSP
jgi:hypothetical protein